jgi:hypothetical protein
MADLHDDDLATLAGALESALHTSDGWYSPPRLYGLVAPLAQPTRPVLTAGRGRWVQLAEGDPYEFLDGVSIPRGMVDAVALAVSGWASPTAYRPGARTGPHPPRLRVRSVVMVTPDRRQCSVLRVRGRPPVTDRNGEGPMLRALVQLWATSEVTSEPPPAA